MAIFIKPGDAFYLPVTLRCGGAMLTDPTALDTVEISLGALRKLWCADGSGTVRLEDGTFFMPISQTESFAMPAGGVLPLDVRVKFAGGGVLGSLRPQRVYVRETTSGEVI